MPRHPPSPGPSDDLLRILAFLDVNPQRAQEKYFQLYGRLFRFFEWQGCWNPDEATDEALDRVNRKLGDGTRVPDVCAFAYGVAKLVWREYSRKQRRHEPLGRDVAWFTPDNVFDEREAQLECLDRCISHLTTEQQDLIQEYYGEVKRAELARALDVNMNVLRLRACRIREKLERCMLPCLRRLAV